MQFSMSRSTKLELSQLVALPSLILFSRVKTTIYSMDNLLPPHCILKLHKRVVHICLRLGMEGSLMEASKAMEENIRVQFVTESL
jgi:hypothetical protein